MVRKLATDIFEDSLTHGALNWDVTIYKALVVVIVAALASCAGDVPNDALDNQLLPYLCYDDKTLKLVGGHDISDIRGTFIIRNEKTNKYVP
jgi:hypothetical protein